jgi:plasmid stability protein
MDTTIRNLDRRRYRELKARAALEGKTLGEATNEAIQAYLHAAPRLEKDRSLAELIPEPYGSGARRLSREIDRIVYGVEP